MPEFVKRYTDLPRLIRMDTLGPLLARDVFAGHQESNLCNWTRVVKAGESLPPTPQQDGAQIPEALRGEFPDFVRWQSSREPGSRSGSP